MNATRPQMQKLAIAAGMTLKDGSAIVVGGDKCPPVSKVAERLSSLGWNIKRMTRDQRSDARDDHGYTGRHFVSQAIDFPDALSAILKEPSGFADCDGPMSTEDWILTHL